MVSKGLAEQLPSFHIDEFSVLRSSTAKAKKKEPLFYVMLA